MTAKEIKELFPIEVKISDIDRQDAIAKGGLHKLGLLLLYKSLPTELHEDIFWGLSIGTVDGVKIKTYQIENHNGKKIETPIYMDRNFDGASIKFELR